MSINGELIQRILAGQEGVSFRELESALSAEGWKPIRSELGALHVTFMRERSMEILTIPCQRLRIGATFIRRIIEALQSEEIDDG